MIEAKSVPFEKRMTLGKVISFTFGKFFKEIAAVGQWLLLMLGVALLNALPIGLIAVSIDWKNAYLPVMGLPASPFDTANMGLLISGCILLLVVLIFDIVFAFYTTAWFNRLGLDAFDGNKRVFGERFNLAFKDLWRLVAPLLLLSLVGIIAMIPYYIVNAMNTMNAVSTMMMETSQPSSPLEIIFYILGMIVAYYVSIKTTAVYGILLENPEMQVMDCFKQSFAMTKGRGWRILGYMISLGLLLVLAFIALFIPGIIVWVIAGVTQFNIGVTGFAVVVTIILYLVLFALSAGIQGMFVAAIYKYLVIEHSEDTPAITEEVKVEETEAHTFESEDSNDTDPMA